MRLTEYNVTWIERERAKNCTLYKRKEEKNNTESSAGELKLSKQIDLYK